MTSPSRANPSPRPAAAEPTQIVLKVSVLSEAGGLLICEGDVPAPHNAVVVLPATLITEEEAAATLLIKYPALRPCLASVGLAEPSKPSILSEVALAAANLICKAAAEAEVNSGAKEKAVAAAEENDLLCRLKGVVKEQRESMATFKKQKTTGIFTNRWSPEANSSVLCRALEYKDTSFDMLHDKLGRGGGAIDNHCRTTPKLSKLNNYLNSYGRGCKAAGEQYIQSLKGCGGVGVDGSRKKVVGAPADEGATQKLGGSCRIMIAAPASEGGRQKLSVTGKRKKCIDDDASPPHEDAHVEEGQFIQAGKFSQGQDDKSDCSSS